MYNLLIVDDEYLSRESIKSIIQEELDNDVKIIEAKNGTEARKIVDKYTLDIIVLDINIPGMNGIDLCRYIKSKVKDTDIVVTTAYDDLSIKNKMLDLNVNKYLVKPIRPQKIIHTLSELLNKRTKDLKPKYSQVYLNKLKTYIINNSYKDSVDTIKEYLEILYKNNDEKFISSDIIQFIDGLESICESQNLCIYQNVNNRINIISKNYYDYFENNILISELIKLTNDIFDVIITKENTSNSYIKDILNYIERNINNNINLEDAANYVNISQHYLSKIFKKETGVNFITYLTDRRIDIAKEMLEDKNIPISNIAIELCYSKSNYFSKVFKKKVGITPSEYREEYLNSKMEHCIKYV